MDAPRFSVGLPQSFDGRDPRPVGIYAARAETLGFSGLWTLDSAVGGPTSRTPLLDGLQVLAYAAAVTRDVRLGIAVIVMNRRQPVLLAKEIASLDRLRAGGSPSASASARRRTSTSRPSASRPTARSPARRGRRGHARAVERRRGLVRRRAPALLAREAGAEADPAARAAGLVRRRPRAALRRAARLGDGWIGAGSSSAEDFARQIPVIRDALADAGRDPEHFAIAKRVYLAVEDDERVGMRRMSAVLDEMYGRPGLAERCAVCGPPERIAETVRELVAAGCQEVSLTPMYGHLAQLERLPEVVRLATAR